MTQATSAKASLSPGMGSAGLSFVTNAVIVLASAVVTSRLYGVDVIGQYGLAMTPWLILVSLSTVSEQIAMIRALAPMRAGSDEATGLAFAVLTMSAGLTALMSVPVLVVAGLVMHGPIGKDFTFLPSVVIVIGYVLFENPAWNLDSVLSAFSRGGRLFWCRLTTVVTFLVVAIAIYPFVETVWGLVIATVVSFACGLVARIVAIQGLIHRWPRWLHYRTGLSGLPELLRYGLRLVPSQFFVGATLQVPLWIVAGSSSIAEVGAYSRASTMSQRLDEASFRINEMLFPDLVRLHLAGDHQRFMETLARTLRLALVGLLLVAALAGGAADPLMSIFGEGFSAAAGALAFLVLAHVCYVAASMVAAAYNSFGKPHYNSAFASIRFVVGLPLTWVFVRNYGITAAAAGLCVGYAIELVVRSVALRRLVHQPHTHALAPSTLIRLLVVYLGGFAVTRGVADAVSSPVLGLVLAVVVGALAYVGLALATRLLDTHDRSAIVGRVLRFVRT